MANKIIIYTDGSSLGNPGPGGWGAVIWYCDKNTVKEIGKSAFAKASADKQEENKTTNNRMEILAAIEALLAVKEKLAEIIIYSDSEYLLNGITKWIYGWIKKGWKTADKKPVLNQELWRRLFLLSNEMIEAGYKISWQKIPGHAGHLGNERADAIATAFAEGRDVTFAHGTLLDYEKLFEGKLKPH